MILNLMEKIITNPGEREAFFSKLKSLESQRMAFVRHTEQIQKQAKENKKKASKKKPHSPVVVTGGTSKPEIRRLQRILRQKIAEVISNTDDPKNKEIRVNDLCKKIASLDVALAQIERAEREQAQQQRSKKNKSKVDSVFLSSDDLTVNRKTRSLLDVDVQTVMPMRQAPEPSVDIVADFETMVDAIAETSVNMEL